MDRPADTVLLVTLDGVRPQELFGTGGADRTAMPFLMDELLPRGSFLGSETDPAAFRMGSPIGISMSGYHSIFKGRLTLCFENDHPAPRGETLVTRVQAAFPDEPKPVKVYVTWPRICDCLKADATRADILRGRREMEKILAERGTPVPKVAPGDTAAFTLAMEGLRAGAPRLFYLGFNQSDAAAHGGDYDRLLWVLENYDRFLRDLVAEMERLEAEGRAVTLIVTTDHGRGDGDEWREHLWKYKGTDRAWVFAMGHGVAARGQVTDAPRRTHYDLRPTIEYLLGIPPNGRLWRGAVMTELLDRDAADAGQSAASSAAG